MIYIIGAGNMGGAIARVLAKKYRIFVYDRHPGKAKIPGTVFDASLKHLPQADCVIIAVKPQDVPALALQIKSAIKSSAPIISVAAGITISRIQKLFQHQKVLRVMPNLGLLVGQGIAAWKAAGLSAQEKLTAKKPLDTISENFQVKAEADIDAVTAISGSGPAYFFYLAEALYGSAKNFGFDARRARRLVEKTFSAAAILQLGKDYKKLARQVRSKKGTTDAALKVFDKYRMSKIIQAGVKAARKRAQELSHG